MPGPNALLSTNPNQPNNSLIERYTPSKYNQALKNELFYPPIEPHLVRSNSTSSSGRMDYKVSQVIRAAAREGRGGCRNNLSLFATSRLILREASTKFASLFIPFLLLKREERKRQ